MKLLLDTHVLVWWLAGDDRRMAACRAVVDNPTNIVLFSVVSLWEIIIKVRIGKLDLNFAEVERGLGRIGLERLMIASAHLATLATLPSFHRDPFDHLLIAQAIAEDATFVSADAVVTLYPVSVMRI